MSEKFRRNLGKLLKQGRLNQNKTQGEIGELCNISKPMVCYIEAGTHTPSSSTLAKMAVACDVSFKQVQNLDGFVHSEHAASDIIEAMAFDIISCMTDAQKVELIVCSLPDGTTPEYLKGVEADEIYDLLD